MKRMNEKENNNQYIKEFWEWSKSSYGQDKSNKDAQNTMVSFNTQHGYGEEGQWVKTQDGDVYIEEITDGKYKGYDRKGELKTGSTKDIIRTLIKKEVLNESNSTYDYGCVMLYFDPDSTIFNQVQNLINGEDIYTDGSGDYGRETEPHVTVLYGLHSNIDDSEVERILNTFTQPEIILENITIFEDERNKGYDVVKFEVNNNELNKMNKKLTQLPYTTDYPDYIPHVTIAYVKSGEGVKYIQKLSNPIKMKPIKIVYSKVDGSKKEFKY